MRRSAKYVSRENRLRVGVAKDFMTRDRGLSDGGIGRLRNLLAVRDFRYATAYFCSAADIIFYNFLRRHYKAAQQEPIPACAGQG